MSTKLQGVDTMSWVLLAVFTLYISIVNPSNTPAFFSNTAFKFALFAFVAVVFVLEGPLVGTMFAIAMALPVVYSSLREGYENPFIERYADEDENDDDKHTDDDDDDTHTDDDKHTDDDDTHKDDTHKDATHKDDTHKDATHKDADKHSSSDHAFAKMLASSKTESSGSSVEPVTESWCNFANVF
jgi:hypothetical protein